MGHEHGNFREYRLLQQHLDKTPTGAPYSPTLIEILKLLFTSQEAELAQKLPLGLKPIDSVASSLGMEKEKLSEKITDMAERGLVFDLHIKNRRYVALAPIVIGFFEFTFMRTRDNLPMAELAKLFDTYMEHEDKFARSVFQKQTQLGRTLVQEDALPDGDFTEILDWERATNIIQGAHTLAVSLCPCRHKRSHINKACNRPQRVCLSLNYGATPMIQAKLAEQITTNEAMEILQKSKEAGLAQTGDNVQRNPTYICNCCGCCCGMMQAARTFTIKNAIVSSNWVMEVNLENCKGCGKCAAACPIHAIEIREEKNGDKTKRWAVVDQSICLGCGVCHRACKFGGNILKPREKRVYTPETVFDKVILMAIERGKLSHMIFDQPTKFSYRALGRIASLIENSPPYKAMMAIKPLKSAFLNAIVKRARKDISL